MFYSKTKGIPISIFLYLFLPNYEQHETILFAIDFSHLFSNDISIKGQMSLNW